jgi:hypothetical protein
MKYGRFLEFHLTADSGWYDFAAQFDVQTAYQVRQLELDRQGDVVNFCNPPSPRAACELKPCLVTKEDLPDRGLARYPISRQDLVLIANGEKPEVLEDVVLLMEWICDPGARGKIRLNSHGSPGGVIWMTSRSGSKDKDTLTGRQFAEFLIRGGLLAHQGDRDTRVRGRDGGFGGVMTICLCLCYGQLARAGSLSVMEQVANRLMDDQLTGIDITGSDREVNLLHHGDGQQWTNDFAAGKTEEELLWYIRDEWKRFTVQQRSAVQPALKQVLNDLMTKQRSKKQGTQHQAAEVPGPMSRDKLRRLYWELLRVKSGDIKFPKGATAGQWGTIVRDPLTGTKTWVRVSDATSHKFKIRTGEPAPWQPGANIRGRQDADVKGPWTPPKWAPKPGQQTHSKK